MSSAYVNDLKGSAPSESWDEKLGEMVREADGDEDGQINYEERLKMMLGR